MKNNIYISTSNGFKYDLEERIIELANSGFKNLELSGGCQFEGSIIDKLIRLKNKFGLRYRVHNYFPPPKEDFAFNFADGDNQTIAKTVSHFKDAINLCRALNIDEFSFHAGFRATLKPNDLGSIKNTIPLDTYENSSLTYFKNLNAVRHLADNNGIKLYIENNVIGSLNYEKFNHDNPFLFTSFNEVKGLFDYNKYNLLLDVGHLYVSCNTLGLDFEYEFKKFLSVSDYIHLSANNGLEDENKSLFENKTISEIAIKNAKELSKKKLL